MKDDYSVGKVIFVVIFVLAFAFGFFCLGSWLVQIIWNAIMPVIFGLTKITFWQAALLKLLKAFLLGSFNIASSLNTALKNIKED